ncbi:MAG: hypothetical protein JJ979_14065, partial [Roseibium sp.]|nr:hypothetical protein [Roseibium sp.]
RIAKTEFAFEEKDAVRSFFTEQTSMFKNLNYAAEGSQQRADLVDKINAGLSAAPTRVTT